MLVAALAVVLFWVAVVLVGLFLVGTLVGLVMMAVCRIRGRDKAVQTAHRGSVGVIEGTW